MSSSNVSTLTKLLTVWDSFSSFVMASSPIGDDLSHTFHDPRKGVNPFTSHDQPLVTASAYPCSLYRL